MVGTYNPEDSGFELEVSASERDREDTLVRICNRDIRRAVEEDRFVVETPGGSVEQSDLRGLKVHLKNPTETHWSSSGPQVVTGPSLLGLEFGLSIDHESVTGDLSNLDSEVVVYGDLHVWRLTDPYEKDVGLNGLAVGKDVVHDHKHWWGTVEEIDWRTDV